MGGECAIYIAEMTLLKHPRNLKAKASHHQLRTLLSDGYRFALSHQATIEAGALQVYHSALPFTPHDTLLYKTYAAEEAKSMHVLRGLPAEWSPCLASLAGGHGSITSVTYSHDGALFALGYDSEFITVREASSGELLSSFKYPASQEILSLAFLPGDKYLVAGTTTRTIAQWSVLTASIVRSYEGHSAATTCVAVCAKTPNVMASASKDTTIRLWDISTGKCVDVLSCHDSPVFAVAFTPEGVRLLSGSEDGIVRIWDVSTPSACSEVRAVSAHKSGITTLAISPDGRTYCTGSINHVVKVFAMDADHPTFKLTDHTKKITWLAYTINGATLLSAGQDERHARLWNTSNGVLRGLTRGYLTQAAFSPNGEQLVTCEPICYQPQSTCS
jgi:WD40 repeat protein